MRKGKPRPKCEKMHMICSVVETTATEGGNGMGGREGDNVENICERERDRALEKRYACVGTKYKMLWCIGADRD